nr:hypothetical protein [Tanacetum cinerariifolium]
GHARHLGPARLCRPDKGQNGGVHRERLQQRHHSDGGYQGARSAPPGPQALLYGALQPGARRPTSVREQRAG